MANLITHISLMVDERLHEADEKMHELTQANQYLQDNVEKSRLQVGKNKEEINRLRDDNLETHTTFSRADRWLGTRPIETKVDNPRMRKANEPCTSIFNIQSAMGNEQSRNVSMDDPTNTARKTTGFECEFVEQPKELPFECPVCLLVLREPHNTSCCDHSFCHGCIKQIKDSNNPVCPLCKQKFEINPRKWLQRALYQLEVYCTYKRDGCEWVGALEQLDKHLNCDAGADILTNGCGFVHLKCHKCSESVRRKVYEVHISDLCEQRPFSCEFCGEYNSTYIEVINNHWPWCPSHPVECTNRCGKDIKRKDLHQHVSRKCPLTSIPCEFCSVLVLRGEMHDHLVSNLTTHVSLMVDDKFDALRQQVDSAEGKISELKRENKCLQDELRVHVFNNEKELHRLREDNQKIQSLYSEMHQQNNELTKKYESLEKKHEDLKRENKELHERASQMSADIVNFKSTEKEKEIATLGATLNFAPTAAENTQGSIRSTSTYATYYDELNTTSYYELSQATSLTGYSQNSHHQHDPYIQAPPVTLIMPDYSAYSSGQKSGQYWVSRPFYSDAQPSYKLCLSVRASGNLSVYVRLMRGEFDNQLDWPFNANITIKLKNHSRGRSWGRNITFRNGHRVTKGTIARGGRGDTNFITLYENSSFVKDDTLWFEVVSVQLV